MSWKRGFCQFNWRCGTRRRTCVVHLLPRGPGHISSKRRCQSKRQQFLPRCSLALNPTPDLVLAPPPSFRPRPAYQLRRLACSVAYLQTSSSSPRPRSERRRRRSARARTPLRCSARKMRFDGRESKRGVTIDGPMGRSKYRGTQGITSMDVVKAEADALKQSNEAPS